MSFSISDGRQPLASTVNVNLAVKGTSNFFVQSDDGLWVSGSFAELQGFFGRYANPLLVSFQRHGLNANMALLLVAIAVLPDLPLASRIFLLALAIALMAAFFRFHRAMNSTTIYLDPSVGRGFLSKALPSLASTLSAAAITGVLAWAYSNATVENLRRLATFLGIP
jgi:hypothetical protein